MQEVTGPTSSETDIAMPSESESDEPLRTEDPSRKRSRTLVQKEQQEVEGFFISLFYKDVLTFDESSFVIEISEKTTTKTEHLYPYSSFI